jgi:hypothetical protein
MMKLGGGVERPFKCVARVAILSRGERKPFAKISTEEKKRKKRSFPLKRIDIQRESALQAAVAVDGQAGSSGLSGGCISQASVGTIRQDTIV